MPNPIEEVAVKGTGVAKAATARIKGLYGVFKTLAAQHGEASVLLRRAHATENADKQRDIWPKLRAELLSHEEAERQEVYPALAKHQMMQAVVERHESDAGQLEAAIVAVDAANYGTESWTRALEKLGTLVKQHVEMEEQEFFPLATDVMDQDTAEAVEQRFKATKQAVMKRLGVE